MSDHDVLRNRVAEAMRTHVFSERDLEGVELGPHWLESADAVIAALNLKANPDPIGKDPGLYVAGWIA